MRNAWLFAAMGLSGCGDDGLGVLYVGIDLVGQHDVELPAELVDVDADAIGESTGRVDVFPAEWMANVDVMGLPALPLGFGYVPVFTLGADVRDVTAPIEEEQQESGELSWDLAGPVLQADEDGGMASMLMFDEGEGPDLGALRCAAVLIASSEEPDPATAVLVLAGEFVFDESGGAAAGGEPAPGGHNHGP